MNKKEIVALLLAGGQGTRLEPLTGNISKPALPFGGGYKIIDFAISNCINSGIDTIGALVQYKPFTLNYHLKEINRLYMNRKEGITILPPYSSESGMSWYKGTAHAVYQNLEFLDYYDPEYVIILSADHIYKMDYRKMMDYHIRRNADMTLGVVQVPTKEASRFGILSTDNDGKVIKFKEKPINPLSNLASMGIYIFNFGTLKKYLSDSKKSIDFGKHILPNMLKDKLSIYAYTFDGYWKDIGVLDSYWQAHIDLLKRNRRGILFDEKWPIYSSNTNLHIPHYITRQAVINNSIISSGAVLYGTINNSVVFTNTYIEKNAIIKDSVILPGVRVGKNTIIEKSIIANDSQIGNNCKVGVYKSANENSLTVLGEKCKIMNGCIIRNGSYINNNDKFHTENEANYA